MTFIEELAEELGVGIASEAPISGYRWVAWRGEAEPPEDKRAELREKLTGAKHLKVERHYDIESDGEVHRVVYW